MPAGPSTTTNRPWPLVASMATRSSASETSWRPTNPAATLTSGSGTASSSPGSAGVNRGMRLVVQGRVLREDLLLQQPGFR